ncbi:unnamed protein product [Brachionus calyciflorus]|uniref:tRNA (32-2'-O)-methyltransferase regulator THADA n=1 Tax=Brachionus calyciflorus TaxID=104777 RepID=A0A813MMQ1_9BILA|nr:unnamed protein product [Brachionus calyciflorus]
MDEIFMLVEKFENLTLKIDDLNSPEKLDTLKNLLDTLKQNEKLFTVEHQDKLNIIIQFLAKELNRTSSKDIIRKLIIRSLNTLTKSKHSDLEPIRKILTSFLNEINVSIGQKLFILNVYLENLDQFGLNCVLSMKLECLRYLTNWCTEHKDELKVSTAPIAISKFVQNLQLLFKTLIIFLQKCHSISENKDDENIQKCLDQIYNSVMELLDLKSIFNLELGYAACMVQVLLKSFESTTIRDLIENSTHKSQVDIQDLCFYQAVLTMLKPQQILNDSFLDLFEKILLLTLNSSTESTDVGYSIAVSRTVNFWIVKLMEMINLKNDALGTLFESEHIWFNKLLGFIWSHFEHNIDVIRNTSLNNYRIILQTARSIKKENAENFYETEVEKSFEISWQSNSKLNALILLIENGCSIQTLSKYNQNLSSELIEAITERSSACLVADLYSRLFKAFRQETKDLDEWAHMWWNPILKCLESENKLRKSYTYEYVLPRVMKQYPDGISHCQKLTNNYSTIISCTKVSRSLGLLNQSQGVFGNVNVDVLEKAMVHHDEQTRLDSLALLCENPKTTESVQEIEFELIKKFLHFNSDTQSASYRQTVIASMKKLFFRFKDSWLFLAKQNVKSKKSPKNDCQIAQTTFQNLNCLYKNFVEWLLKFIFESLHLDSTFAKRNQNLLLLSLFIDIIGLRLTDDNDKCNNNNHTEVCFDFQSIFDRKRVLTLVECLWDTYTNNKNLALELLIKIDRNTFDKFDFAKEDYFKIALQLLSSRKPIDSMTSVYLMLFIQSKSDFSSIEKFKKITDLAVLNDSKSVNMFLVESILSEFRIHCQVARENLLIAALQKPVYGPLAAIRNLITQSVNEIKACEFTSEWKRIIDELIELCFEVSKVVSPIVNSKSPEGIFPTELVSMQPEIVNSDLLKSVTPQMLLVCCWRSMKEISLFFGDLVRLLPIEFESQKESSFLLASSQVNKIGDYFVRHLFETRHRGAFELAYIGFTSMCETFWKCNTGLYCNQTLKWTDYVLNLIQTEESKIKLCSTRRGGGLPFFVQAIVSTELVENGRKTLSKCMNVLLKLVEVNDADEENFSKVLAMYILSALFKDTRLGEDVLQYAETALIAAINGFDSVYWNVRNASTLLFSSLINRIFGVNRSKEEISKKNSMPGRMFFSKFPQLYQFFQNVISTSIETLESNLNAKLYLVVLILCHLFTLSDEITDPEALLHNYIPLLLKCSKSPVMKTRIFIAKSIASIVNLNRYPNLIQEIFVEHLDEKSLNDNNKIHGLLEILSCLIDKYNIFKFINFEEFFNNLEKLLEINHCAINYGSLLSLLTKIFYNQKTNFLNGKNIQILVQMADKLEKKSLYSMAKNLGNTKNFILPGTHDLLLAIGESYCIRVYTYANSECLFECLLDSFVDYSMNLKRGVVKFLNNMLQNNGSQEVFKTLEIIGLVFKTKMIEAVVNSSKIDNILNLKTVIFINY